METAANELKETAAAAEAAATAVAAAATTNLNSLLSLSLYTRMQPRQPLL